VSILGFDQFYLYSVPYLQSVAPAEFSIQLFAARRTGGGQSQSRSRHATCAIGALR
jgi:hypothetical protein